jgi:hypothetical protein
VVQHVRQPSEPRALFDAADEIGQSRAFRTPATLFASLQRLFGVQR